MAAFEVHPALILRKVIDENLGGGDGHKSFRLAWQQLESIIEFVDTVELKSVNGELPVWSDEHTELPQYWLPENEVKDWLGLWNEAFEKASHNGGLDKD
jgi:hypothetical protein